MITEQQRTDVYNAVKQKQLDPLYKYSPEENYAINAVLDADLSEYFAISNNCEDAQRTDVH